jgi:2-oxoglutarate ferredoxin oxidoreductase subunit delta
MAVKGKPVIDRERCKGCLLCARACPVKILGPDARPNSWGYYPSTLMAEDRCIACGNCYQVCPDVAITVYRQ